MPTLQRWPDYRILPEELRTKSVLQRDRPRFILLVPLHRRVANPWLPRCLSYPPTFLPPH